MAKPGFAGKRGFKRANGSQQPFKKFKNRKLNRGAEKFVPKKPLENDSENWSDENSEGELETKKEEREEEDFREPTMYDNLLKKLDSRSQVVANTFKQRKREEKSDAEDDESENELEDGSEGSIDENAEENGMLGSIEKSEGSGSDEEIGASDSDEEYDLKTNVASITKESLTTSHLEYKLSQGEIVNLLKRQWNYKWDIPARGAPNCKWRGTGDCFLKETDMNEMYGLKPRLYKHWIDIYRGSGGTDFQASDQRFFFSICNSYRDVLHHNKKPFYLKGLKEDSSILDAYVMHTLNHIFRARDLVSKNDAKVADAEGKGDVLNSDCFLDHGFTRPKVLILLPLGSIAFRVVKRMIQLTPAKHKVNIEHIDRFTEEFGSRGVESEEDEEDAENSKGKKSSKPSDFQSLFGGTNEDHFMIGVKYMGRKIKLYADFYSSDIIVASPIGLITKIGEAEGNKEKDVDYLSSIEVLIIDHADVILMQNWSHVNTVVEHLNRLPAKQHGTDIMRIRPWYLDGQAQFYRQTIILGCHLNPDINSLFSRQCLNYQGKVKLVCPYKGVLPKVLIPVRQIYERFDADSIADIEDARFQYFCQKVFPKVKDFTQGGIMLFVRSYFEFVRLRNFLKSQEASFCLLGDYTKQSDISRARVWFFQGQRKIMLYTERAHFYHRYKIRGVQNLIIYSLPERKEFYPEIVNMLEGSQNMSCTVLFSLFDKLRLERVVGSSSAKRMVTSEKGVFVFC